MSTREEKQRIDRDPANKCQALHAEGQVSWIKFLPSGVPPKQVTLRWVVTSLDGDYLGEIRWFPPWRRYAYTPSACSGIVWFEQDCLREIAQFIEDRTREHKEKRRLPMRQL